mgnify:FL=1
MNTIYRSRDDKVIAGVCAGIAKKLDINVTGLRWIVAIFSLFSGFPIIIYIILWATLKER